MRRAQLKMGETIMVLIIFFFLLVFGVVFYAKYKAVQMEKQINENEALRAIQYAEKAQFLPEIQCTRRAGASYNCVDLMKLNAMKELSGRSKLIYRTMFPNTHIAIMQVFPEKRGWIIYDEAEESNNLYFFPVPVALYNATAETFSYGYINVTVYT